MKCYEFGKENKTTIMFLPGNMMTHRQFELLVPMLETDYHIITVSFDGFDETGETTYTTAKNQAEKLAAYIRKNLNGRIDLVYAESLGSAPALFLTRSKTISIGGVIVSGAQYLDVGIFNKPYGCIASAMTWKMLQKIKKEGKISFPKFILKKFGRTQEEFDGLNHMMSQACFDLSKETLRATFDEGLKLYQHVNHFEPRTDLPLACWYGEGEKNMKKAVKALKRAFPNMEDHPFAGLGHGSIVNNEELLIRDMEAFMMRHSII